VIRAVVTQPPLMAYHFKSDLSEALDHKTNSSQNDKYYSCVALFTKRSGRLPSRSLNVLLDAMDGVVLFILVCSV
jgi:hypothetical protein